MGQILKPYMWNWPSITANDTFPGFQIKALDEPDGTLLVRVLMQLRDADGELIYEADSDGTGVEIVNAANYEIAFASFRTPANAGDYFYDIELTDNANVDATIINGKLTVLPEVSRKLPPTPTPTPDPEP
jgi:hypothetical protein